MSEKQEMDHRALTCELDCLAQRYSTLKLSHIGNSVMGRPLYAVTIGDETAKKGVLYVATHHAAENVCSHLMLDFIKEYLKSIEEGRYVFGINARVLYQMRQIRIVPMLNPDGVDYRLNGVDESNPLRERLVKYNGGEDFSKWSANARGVDLNHNYNAYFDEYKALERDANISPGKTRYSGEGPESEPEVSALANYIRYNSEKIDGIISFHTQGEEIYYKSRGNETPKSEFIARRLSKMTGYILSEAEGMASYGGLTDWFIKEYNKPSFTLECGKGENPLPVSIKNSIYIKIREAMFTFPILI